MQWKTSQIVTKYVTKGLLKELITTIYFNATIYLLCTRIIPKVMSSIWSETGTIVFYLYHFKRQLIYFCRRSTSFCMPVSYHLAILQVRNKNEEVVVWIDCLPLLCLPWISLQTPTLYLVETSKGNSIINGCQGSTDCPREARDF